MHHLYLSGAEFMEFQAGWLFRITSSASECSTHVLINIIVGDASWFHCGIGSLGLITTDIIIKLIDMELIYNK